MMCIWESGYSAREVTYHDDESNDDDDDDGDGDGAQ